MFLPKLEFPTPANFFCKKCVKVSEIPGEISIRKPPDKTIVNDMAVSDVIGCEKSLREKVLRELKGAERKLQLYK